MIYRVSGGTQGGPESSSGDPSSSSALPELSAITELSLERRHIRRLQNLGGLVSLRKVGQGHWWKGCRPALRVGGNLAGSDSVCLLLMRVKTG